MEPGPLLKMICGGVLFFFFFMSVADLAAYRSEVVRPFMEKHGLKTADSGFRRLFGMWNVHAIWNEWKAMERLGPSGGDAGRILKGMKLRMMSASAALGLLILLEVMVLWVG